MINQNDMIAQKNLGPDIAKLVGAITEYNPGISWEEVDE